ncbi:MlaD family protein [Myxococcota bacterium]|nr:MlaD family protein [Myxococcota bacterium]
MSPRRTRKHEIGVGLLLVAALLVLIWLTLQIGAFHGVTRAVRVTATFPDASGLVEDGAVRVAGVKVGSVTDLAVRDGRAVATLTVDARTGLRRGGVATIRARSVLGEKYVDLTLGDPAQPLLQDGDEIAETRIPMEIDQMVTALGPLLEKVDPADVEVLISTAARIAREEGGKLGPLLDRADRVLANLEVLSEAAPELRRDLPALLRDARAATRGLPSTVARADAVLARADTLAARLDAATDGLPETSKEVQAMVRDLRPAVEDVARAGERADEVVAKLERVLDNLSFIDREEIVRLLREEGVLVRVRSKKYPPREEEAAGDGRTGASD